MKRKGWSDWQRRSAPTLFVFLSAANTHLFLKGLKSLILRREYFCIRFSLEEFRLYVTNEIAKVKGSSAKDSDVNSIKMTQSGIDYFLGFRWSSSNVSLFLRCSTSTLQSHQPMRQKLWTMPTSTKPVTTRPSAVSRSIRRSRQRCRQKHFSPVSRASYFICLERITTIMFPCLHIMISTICFAVLSG